MAKDSKKSFFELNQENPYRSQAKDSLGTVAIKSEVKTPDHQNASEKEDGELDATVIAAPVVVQMDRKEIKYLDMDNALDYEDVGSEPEESDVMAKKTNKSESMALAFGVQVKANDLAAEKDGMGLGKEKSRRDKPSGNDETKIDRGRKERSVERKERREGVRRASRSPLRRNANDRNNRVERRGGRGGRVESDSRRRRSRSIDRKPRGSPDRRRRTKSRDRRRSNSRSRRNRSRTRSRSKDRRNRRVSRSRSKSSRRDRDRKSKEASPPPPPKISSLAEDKERMNKEKMMKRAEALLLLKDHMRKEIEEQKRLAELKANEPPTTKLTKSEDKELAMLEKLKAETLDKLRKQEEIKQLAAVKKVLEVVAAGVKNAHKKKKQAKRSSSSSSSEDERKGSRSDRRKRSRKYSSSD